MEPPAYARLTAAHVRALREATGVDHVSLDPERLEQHSHDETENLRFLPEVVVCPGSTEEVSRVMRLASAERIPVTPCGARTGLSGGALCIYGGISLSTERMARILEIDEQSFMAVVQPGVITEELQTACEQRGLFYAPDPASRGSCTIGGNVAENAGGPRAVKYGVTEDWVRGVEAVLPTGEVVRQGGKRLKDVTGYNLAKLLVGSEGTLAVVTEVTLKLLALPQHRRTMLVPFATIDQAAEAVPTIFLQGISPSAIEFMERAAVEASDRQLGTHTARGDAEAYLLLELDGNDETALEAEYLRLGEACLSAGALDVWIAEGPTRAEALWRVRRAMGEAVKRLSVYREEDTVVPRARLPEAIRAVREVTAHFGVDAICYGHAGDGNIHVNVLKRDMSEERWRAVSPEISYAIFERIVALGGTISGEHGVGYIQKPNLKLALSEETIALSRRLKRAFDPAWILNPGKVFDSQPETLGG